MSTGRSLPVAAALALVGALLLGGCNDDDSGYCGTANDYVWNVDYFAGAHGGPPEEGEFEPVMSTIVDLADTLTTTVPSDHRDEARTAHQTWVTAYDLFARYDFSDDRLPDDFGAQLQDELGANEASNDRFVASLRDECGAGDKDWPSKPASAD